MTDADLRIVEFGVVTTFVGKPLFCRLLLARSSEPGGVEMAASIKDRLHGGSAIQAQMARWENDGTPRGSWSSSFPESRNRKDESGLRSFAGTEFESGFSTRFDRGWKGETPLPEVFR